MDDVHSSEERRRRGTGSDADEAKTIRRSEPGQCQWVSGPREPVATQESRLKAAPFIIKMTSTAWEHINAKQTTRQTGRFNYDAAY